jgi:hypothetical protein
VKRKLPKFETDEEAEAFLDPSRDLSDYLHRGNFRPVEAEPEDDQPPCSVDHPC